MSPLPHECHILRCDARPCLAKLEVAELVPSKAWLAVVPLARAAGWQLSTFSGGSDLCPEHAGSEGVK